MNHDPKSLNELIKASKYCGNCGAKFDEVKRGKFCFIHAEHLFCIECLSCLYTGRNLRKPSKMCLIFFRKIAENRKTGLSTMDLAQCI